MGITQLLVLAALAAAPTARADVACATADGGVTAHFPKELQIESSDTPAVATEIQVAKDFAVAYYNDFKFVTNIIAGEHYVLTLCGATAPTKFENGTAFPAGTTFFTVPLTGVATGSTVSLTFLEMLGLRHTLKIVDPKNVHSPCIQQGEESGAIVGHAASKSWSTHPLWTKLINETAAVAGVFTDKWGTAASKTDKDISFDATSDPGLLRRAEWIKFMGLFFNKEPEANKYYTAEAAAVAAITAKIQGAGTAKKSCAWIGTYWKGGWEISAAAYKKDICSAVNMDALPAQLFAANESAAFHSALSKVDVLIDETYFSDPKTADKATVLDKLANITLGASQLLLRLDRRISDADTLWYNSSAAEGVAATHGLDWFEGAVAKPATVVADLAAKVWPAVEAPATGCASYFRDINAGEMPIMTGSAHCTAEAAAMKESKCASVPADAAANDKSGVATRGGAAVLAAALAVALF